MFLCSLRLPRETNVLRFGQLFLFPSFKSFPFLKTESGCKGTKFPEYNKDFCKKNLSLLQNCEKSITFVPLKEILRLA